MPQENPIALITGCSSGIGLATATLLHAHHWEVHATVRKPEDMAHLATLGLHPLLCDLNDHQAIHHAVQTFLGKTHNRCDALINNAGYAQCGAIEDIHPDALKQQFQTNVFGLHELTQALLPTMRQQRHGRIVMISSILGLTTLPYRGAYCASKHALEALASALRMELHGSGVHVSVVQPGPIASAFRKNARDAFQKQPLQYHQHHKYYQHWAATQLNDQRLTLALSPDDVAKKCWHAVSSQQPRNYYKVTLPAYLLAILHNCLPSRWVEFLMRTLKV